MGGRFRASFSRDRVVVVAWIAALAAVVVLVTSCERELADEATKQRIAGDKQRAADLARMSRLTQLFMKDRLSTTELREAHKINEHLKSRYGDLGIVLPEPSARDKYFEALTGGIDPELALEQEMAESETSLGNGGIAVSSNVIQLLLALFVIQTLLSIAFAHYIAQERGYLFGFLFGLLFGFVGIFIAACLPMTIEMAARRELAIRRKISAIEAMDALPRLVPVPPSDTKQLACPKCQKPTTVNVTATTASCDHCQARFLIKRKA